MFALHGFESDIFERNATAGDELIFVEGFSGNLELGGGEEFDEEAGLILGEVGPGLFFRDIGGLPQAVPKAAGDALEWRALQNTTSSMCGALSFKYFSYLIWGGRS